MCRREAFPNIGVGEAGGGEIKYSSFHYFIIRAVAKGFYSHRSRDHNRKHIDRFLSLLPPPAHNTLRNCLVAGKIYQNLISQAEIFCVKSIKSYTWFEFKQFSVVI